MAYRVKLVMNPPKQIEKRLNLEQRGKVEKFLASTCAKAMDPYVPYREGPLSDYKIHGNEIWYEQEYAQYQYKGVREDGTHQINPENRTRTTHPFATSYWDEEMMANKRARIEKEVELAIERFANE